MRNQVYHINEEFYIFYVSVIRGENRCLCCVENILYVNFVVFEERMDFRVQIRVSGMFSLWVFYKFLT